MNYRINFDELDWEKPIEGVKHKFVNKNDTKIRFVEYSKDMPRHWCSKGHIGYMIEGEMEIEYANEVVLYKKGDAIFIPDGDEHRHKGKVLGEKATVFFIEKV